MNNPNNVIETSQWGVAAPWLIKRAAERRHLVVYLSGAHAYGFPSPDSDLDLKCVHIAPTAELVGLKFHPLTVDFTEVVDGVELDYTSNELGMVLRGISSGNGNYIERLLGNTIMDCDQQWFESARTIAAGLLSRRVAAHYAGFATSQLNLFDKKPTAKRALYVLRTAATGRALLATGRIVTDLTLLPEFCPIDITALLAAKIQGEKSSLDAASADALRAQLNHAIALVHNAVDASCLPAEPSDESLQIANEWLISVRRF